MSAYPGALDALPNPSATTAMDATGYEHDLLHGAVNDAVEAVQAELGTHPSAAYSTVTARLTAMDAAIVAAGAGGGSGGDLYLAANYY